MKRFRLRTVMLAISVLAMVMNARADFINVNAWVTPEGDINTATGGSPATLALSTCHMGTAACTAANADVAFTTTGINFDTSSNTISAWLASSLFPVDGLTFQNGVTGSTALDPTIWEFSGTGSFTNGQTFTFDHDDGVTMIVGGVTYVDQPAPTGAALTTATYTGPTGNQSFEIIYDECCSPPAVLQTTLVGPANAPVPEPGTLILLGSGLLALASTMRRKLRS